MAQDRDGEREEQRLRRRRMVDGGEVVSGETASAALDAVGARAMTFDRQIIVHDDFDPDDPEDQAVYAHERLHLRHSGGEDAHHGDHDAEEQEARRVERMVLHRRRQGDDLGTILRDVEDGRIEADEDAGADAAHEDAGGDDTDPMDAYRQLVADGWTHEAIVRMLAEHVMHEVALQEEELQVRSGGHGMGLSGGR